LRALISCEIRITLVMRGQERAGQDGVRRLRGPVWDYLLKEENDAYEGAGDDASAWSLVALTYAPGAWYFYPIWRQHNDAGGDTRITMMRFDPIRDGWFEATVRMDGGGFISFLGEENCDAAENGGEDDV
jgi:hypothetical protein